MAQQIYDNCSRQDRNNNKQCFSDKILKAINEDPKQTAIIFSDLSNMAKEGQLGDNLVDYLSYHGLAHEAGMLLFHKFNDLFRAYSFCNTLFSYGCEHGVVMEYLDSKAFDNPITVKEVAAVCDRIHERFSLPHYEYTQCIHATGHSLVVLFKGDVHRTLNECESFPLKDLCKRAVLREYSKGESHLGRHSHKPPGSFFLPCYELEESHRSACYYNLGRNSRNFTGKETLSQSYKICFQIPFEFKSDCLEGFANDILSSTFENVERSIELCNYLKEIRDDCLKALIVVGPHHNRGQDFVRELEVKINSQTSME